MSELHGHTEEDEAKDDVKFFKKWHRDSSVFKRNGSLIFFSYVRMSSRSRSS